MKERASLKQKQQLRTLQKEQEKLTQKFQQKSVNQVKLKVIQINQLKLNQKIVNIQKTIQRIKIPNKIYNPTIIKGITFLPLRFKRNKSNLLLLKTGFKLGFNVFGKYKNKFIRINKTPLSKRDALSRGSYAIDKTTSRTFKIVPIGYYKNLGNLLGRERGYYTKVKPKFREYKIKKGKSYVITMKYIEKKRAMRDTISERKGLSLIKLKQRNRY